MNADKKISTRRRKDAETLPTPSGAELLIALEHSLKLQAHYAKLLNQYDGGERIQFLTVDSWLARLYETQTLSRLVSVFSPK